MIVVIIKSLGPFNWYGLPLNLITCIIKYMVVITYSFANLNGATIEFCEFHPTFYNGCNNLPTLHWD